MKVISNKEIFHLLRTKAFINGQWVESSTGETYEVYNPSTLQVVGRVPALKSHDVYKAIEAASIAQNEWKSLTARTRGQLIKRWCDKIIEHKDVIARVVTAEMGKPIKDSLGEVFYAANFLDWYAEEARHVFGDILPSDSNDRHMMIWKEPIGVSVCITPWNFPIAMITRKAGAALAAGCCTIIKPSEETPLSALILAELTVQAGIPPGVFNVVTCNKRDTPLIGEQLCKDPLVRKISFTGSYEVGKLLMSHASEGVKSVSLELGGNGPFIVMPSANMETALRCLMHSKFRNSGQACIASNRFLVHSSRVDEFVGKVYEMVRDLRVGDGNSDSIEIGPLINSKSINKIDRLVQEAVANGAKVEIGGHRLSNLTGYFYQPTLITGISNEMRIAQEEIFGPVIAVQSFETEEEAVTKANQVRQGLSSYLISEDYRQIMRISRKLQCGMIGVNEGAISQGLALFGGVKQSGLGREGSKYALNDYIVNKYVCLGDLD